LLGANSVGASLPETRGERQEALPASTAGRKVVERCGERNGSYRHGLYTREAADFSFLVLMALLLRPGVA